MKTFPFRLTSEDDLILLEAFVNEYPIVLALDTAASQTVIDWNTLILAGFNEEALAQNIVEVETAAGVMETWVINIPKFQTLDTIKIDFPILTYDFFDKGLFSTYDGVLGLDFFRENGILTIDFIEEKLMFKNN